MLALTPAKEIRLRPYQADAVEALRANIRAGRKRLVLCAGTGAGKTLTSAHLLNEAARKGSYSLFIVDRLPLVKQTSEVFDEYGIKHGVVQGSDNKRWDPHEHVQVCSAQTLARRCLPRSPSLIVVDEAHCFVAGTLISTPHGHRPIEEIQPGDCVYNATGIGWVRHSFRSDAPRTVKVTFHDGSSIECTPDHRFLTADAWVQARLLDGKSAFGIEDMPHLWRALSAADIEDGEGQLAGGTRGLLAQADLLLSELCQEVEEPDAQVAGAREDGANPAADRSYADITGRERARADRAAAAAFSRAWTRVAGRICGADENSEGPGVPDPLQDRFGGPSADDSGRDRRREPCQLHDQGERREKGCLPSGKRVVSVEAVERPGSRPVFNLHVSGHPSFFAGGVLVHNCQYQGIIDYMDRHPNAVKIGLTATPFTKGMGKHWDGMVNVRSTRLLINDGHLVEPTIYVARSPDDADLGVNSFGEFSDESAAAAGIRIVGDVVAEWTKKTHEHFGRPAKTIVFSPTVEHGRELCAAFAAAGYNFQQISYLDRSDAERDAKITEFRKPESLIHGLVSCGVLTKGFDVPDTLIGISCRPYRKSLSSHMQEIGRVMRAPPGKSKALWLDHSGNIERFALDMFDVWENGAGELSKAEKRDSTVRKRDASTREKVVCPECGGALHGNLCMACGWEKPAQSGIIAVDGALREFNLERMAMEPRPGLRAQCLKDPRVVWNAALSYCIENSHRQDSEKARKWAYGVWRGVYPSSKLPFGWFDMKPALADTAALGLIEREVKRFRKQNKRSGA